MRPIALMFALALAGPAAADGLVGPYLAGRAAASHFDYRAAAENFTRALQADPSNQALMENAVLAQIGVGDLDKAQEIARALDASGVESGLADLALLAGLAQAEDYEGAIAAPDAGRSAGPLVDGLYRAWAQLGAGQMSEAVAAFDAVSAESGLRGLALYHKALALASVGDFEGADKILSGDAAGPLRATRRGVIAHAQILSQLERNPAAIELIDKIYGTLSDPDLITLRADLAAGKTLPFTLIGGPKEGLAEVFFSVASALASEADAADPSTTTDILMFARTAIYLRPDLGEAVLLTAGNLEAQGQHQLAIDTYGLIEPGSAAYVSAEIGRSDALLADDRPDAAIEALQQLSKAEPGILQVWSALGDALRRNERFSEGIEAYSRAIDLFEGPDPGQWVVYYTRGICYEREDLWPEAEADFRKALELAPDQPQVLNYLGYSFLELKTNLDEAIGMIERASRARPNDGAITDSLGWAQYRLGRYDEAVQTMERAIELMPVDPVVNDHLGDVYWAVGRKREAEFQWKRALSFKPETEEEAARIRRKLEVGLDVVLEEEGAEPLDVTDNGTNGG
jgi:tetratricopeptide (TPR) repeat protein